ncbi:MAG: methylenetetrahydrofolate reductase, partial [Candidatus Bathyarchaeia archaeon]
MTREAFSELTKAIQAGTFVYTGEIEPLKTTSLEETLETAKILKGHVVAANITDNPTAFAYMNALIPSYFIQKEIGLEAVYQVTVRDRNRLAITADLLAASALGIKNVLALSGDHTTVGDDPGTKPVYDLDSTALVDLLRKMVDDGTDFKGNKIDQP